MLPIELIAATAVFAFVTSATPGPNNIMLTASGANFGFTRTIPHIVGIVFGVAVLNICVGLGLGALFYQFPILQSSLRVAGSAYLLWLAYKLLRFSALSSGSDARGKPFSFWQAVAFQFINPKAWVMMVSANVSFAVAGDAYWLSVAMIVITFMLIGPPSIMIWAGFGHYISRFLHKRNYLLSFNIFMSVLTAACVVFIWLN